MDVFGRNRNGTVRDDTQGSDWRLARIVSRPCSPSSENIAAKKTIEQHRVDDIHNHGTRRYGQRVRQTDATVPDYYAVRNPEQAHEAAADKGDEIHCRV